MRPRFAAGIAAEICRWNCGWVLLLEMWRRLAAIITARICCRKRPPRIEMRKRHHHPQGQDGITGKGKGYAASGSEESYVDLSTYTKSFSHLERSPLKRRWDCSCAVLSFSWIADRIGPPVLQSSLLQSGWESVWNIQNTLVNSRTIQGRIWGCDKKRLGNGDQLQTRFKMTKLQ